MTEPLWTDERIDDALRECALLARGMDVYTSLTVAENVTRQLRDSYEARIAELQAAQVEPVTDGVYRIGGNIWRISSDMVGVAADVPGTRMYTGKLPDGWKLTRPVAGQEEAQP